MKIKLWIILIALCAACKKEETTETGTQYTKHTIYYEATIETTGDAEISGIFYNIFKGDTVSGTADYKIITDVPSKHWVSDTMSFYDDGVKLYVVSQFAALANATDSAILTLKTIIDGKEAGVAADTGTAMEVHNEMRYDFN